MQLQIEDDRPRICLAEGLTCEHCTENTATHLASICRGLRGAMVASMFVQIHPHPSCARMHAHFAESYIQASTAKPAAVPRKPVAAAAFA